MGKYYKSTIIKRLSKDHFGSVSNEIIQLLAKGQCSAVYGIPGYGMDYFAKHIQLLINKNYPKINVIFLNLQFNNHKIPLLKKEFSKLTNTKKIDEITLSKFLNKNKIMVILGEVYKAKYRKLFKYLKAIRSLNPTNFTVLTVANYTLFKYPKRYMKYGGDIFFTLKLIPNFDLEGVKRIMRINNEEYNWRTPLNLSKKILFLSGGNPGLVKNTCQAIYDEGIEILSHPEKLIKHHALHYRIAEIAELATKLNTDEQIKLGILNNNGTIFASLISEYLKNNVIDGLDNLFPNLTKTDRRIFTLFIRNKNKIIDKDQLSIVLDQTADTYSQWAIYKAIARVRDKIKDRYKIKTLRGRGWIMEDK